MIGAGAHKVFDRSTQADSDQECIEWDACMHPGPGYNFPEKNGDARELVLMRPDAGLPGAAADAVADADHHRPLLSHHTLKL